MKYAFEQISPIDDDLTPEAIRGITLGALSEQYGTGGLYVRLEDTFERVGLDTNEFVQVALELAFNLHVDDWRTNGHSHDHLIRVTLRVIEEFENSDPDSAFT